MPKLLMSRQQPTRRSGWGRLDLPTALALVFFAVILLGLGYQWGASRSTVPEAQARAPVANFAPQDSRTRDAAGSSDAASSAPSGSPAALRAVLDAPSVGLPTIRYSALPPEGRDVLGQIVGAYDFEHDKDGTVFGNRERILPAQKRGFYREYTVETPGVSHRGARRLVCGGPQPRAPLHCFYTADHYASFRQVVH